MCKTDLVTYLPKASEKENEGEGVPGRSHPKCNCYDKGESC